MIKYSDKLDTSFILVFVPFVAYYTYIITTYLEKCKKMHLSSTAKGNVKTIIICFLISLLLGGVILSLHSGEDTIVIEDGGPSNAIGFDHYLDSSLSCSARSTIETSTLLNAFNDNDICSAHIFINSGLAAGSYISLSQAEDQIYLNKLLNILFDNSIHYEETSLSLEGSQYSFYLEFSDSSGASVITIFIIDPSTIRCDGQFYKASNPLDYSGTINRILYNAVRKQNETTKP